MTQPSRAELVERLITADRRTRIAETALRDLCEDLEGDRSLAAHLLVLQTRIQILEQNQARLIADRAKGAAA